VTRAGLAALALPGTDAPIIDELAQASDTNPIVSVLADAALLDLDRCATGQGLRYSRVGTTLMLAAPTEQRLTDAIDTVAAAAINTGARVTDLTAQYIDDEKALASVGIDPWTTRPSDDPTGQADRILYVGRDGAHIHVKAGRIIVDAPGALPATSLPKNSVTRIVLSGNVGLSAGARSWAMRGGVDVVCLSRRGSYQGTLIGSNRAAHASRLLAQVALTGDQARRVHLAGAFISAKIRGQIHVLTRIARRDRAVHVADTTAHMHAWRRSLAGVRTLDDIMGAEGTCSNAYFDALAAYEAACQRSVTGALPGYSGSWRRHITHSAQMLAHVRARLAALISEGDVVVHIYPICSSCADHADILGAAIALDDVGLCRGVGEGLADVLNRFRDANRFTRGWMMFRGEQLCGFQCSSFFGVPVIEVRRVVLPVLFTRHVSHWDAVCVAKRCPLECLNPRELVETIGYLIVVDRVDRLCPQTPVELSVASS